MKIFRVKDTDDEVEAIVTAPNERCAIAALLIYLEKEGENAAGKELSAEDIANEVDDGGVLLVKYEE